MKTKFTFQNLIASAMMVVLFSFTGMAQSLLSTTYYYIGGTAPTNNFTSNSNWNTQLNGGGISRSVAGALPDDILIVDGTNVGGTTPTTGTVTANVSSTTIAQLIFQNNANVILQRVVGGGGSGTIDIKGDLTSAPDFVVGPGSSIIMNSPAADGNVQIIVDTLATGTVAGTITMTNTGSHRITSQNTGGLLFANGSVFNSDCTPPTSGYPFGSSSQGVNFGIVFQSGATLNLTGFYSPFGGSSSFQACQMLPGSNFYVKTSNVSGNGTFTSGKSFGNLYIQNNATFTCDGTIIRIGNLTIDNGCTFITHTSGSTPVLGNLVVNGTFNAPSGSSNSLVMGGSSPQNISGSGAINAASFVVANNSEVTLSKSISVARNANVYGKLTFAGTNQITGVGRFSSAVLSNATTLTGNIEAGSYQITGVVGTISGNIGLSVSGSGLDAGTNIVGSSTGGTYLSLSKPALTTATGVTFNFSSDSATLIYSNPNGMDSVNGAVAVTGLKSFQTGTNYVINGTTTWPFGFTSGSTSSSVGLGNVTINGAVSTNYNARIRGTLTLGTGKLTILPNDTVRIVSGNSIGGAPFTASNYIVCGNSASGVGALRMDDISSSRVFPVGTATNYLPVTLTPAGAMSMVVSVFQGVTSDGLISGTPFTTAQKDKIVDAVWTINQPIGTGDCSIQLNWVPSLEGATFSTFTDPEIGIARNSSGSWDVVTGSGNGTLNNATAIYNSFGPFCVGQVGFILPVSLKNISAKSMTTGTQISWNVANEDAAKKYVVEKSLNGTIFSTLGFVDATGKGNYSYLDIANLKGTFYYRIKIISLNGTIRYSNIVSIRQDNSTQISFYPNPVKATLMVSGLKANSIISISNSSGQKVLQLNTAENATSINTEDLKAGWYTVEIFNDNQRVISKSFIKN